MKEMLLSVRKWDCSSYGNTDIDRDLNADLHICDKDVEEFKAAGRLSLLMVVA